MGAGRKKVARLTPRQVMTIGTKPSASRISRRGRAMENLRPLNADLPTLFVPWR
jgi:hypothetical protein